MYKESRKRKTIAEVNVRAVVALREIDRGHSSLLNFSRCMNMACLTERAYNNINDDLFDAYESAAMESMKQAAADVLEASAEKYNDEIGICQCSRDGSRQK